LSTVDKLRASLTLALPTFVHRGQPCASLADSLDGDDANMFTRIGHLIVDHAEAVEERRATLFHKLHKSHYARPAQGEKAAASKPLLS
jgi:hypothetical protein